MVALRLSRGSPTSSPRWSTGGRFIEYLGTLLLSNNIAVEEPLGALKIREHIAGSAPPAAAFRQTVFWGSLLKAGQSEPPEIFAGFSFQPRRDRVSSRRSALRRTVRHGNSRSFGIMWPMRSRRLTAPAGPDDLMKSRSSKLRRCHAVLSYVYSAAREIAANLKGFTVVVAKSSVPVGTGDEVKRLVRESNVDADGAIASKSRIPL
jgi:hypothetical protein